MPTNIRAFNKRLAPGHTHYQRPYRDADRKQYDGFGGRLWRWNPYGGEANVTLGRWLAAGGDIKLVVEAAKKGEGYTLYLGAWELMGEYDLWGDGDDGESNKTGNDYGIFDARGQEIFDRWMSGKGGKVYYQDGIWGEYMKANELLRRQILNALQSDASRRRGTGPVNLRFHAEIENGYFTGYEMLHGTHSALGDFEINGIAIMQDNLITYQVQMTWHDIIDPNPAYGGDRISATFLNAVGNPKDYEIHISWSDTFIIGN